eukprot:scaffold3243_cov173-Ochromonas_danica.AAC.45
MMIAKVDAFIAGCLHSSFPAPSKMEQVLVLVLVRVRVRISSNIKISHHPTSLTSTAPSASSSSITSSSYHHHIMQCVFKCYGKRCSSGASSVGSVVQGYISVSTVSLWDDDVTVVLRVEGKPIMMSLLPASVGRT